MVSVTSVIQKVSKRFLVKLTASYVGQKLVMVQSLVSYKNFSKRFVLSAASVISRFRYWFIVFLIASHQGSEIVHGFSYRCHTKDQ